MLSQAEADSLLAVPKTFASMAALNVGGGVNYMRDLLSADAAEAFLLDVRRNQYRLSKLRYQNRARRVFVIARLCVEGPRHTNPDGTSVGRTHLHRFVEGYEDKFADAVAPTMFSDLTDPSLTLAEFCRFCNIGAVPPIVEVAALGHP